MIKEIKGHTGPVWAIAHNSENAFHPMKLEIGQVMTTGQPFLEKFENEELMVERLVELAGDDSAWVKPSTDTEED
jgi:hypothetical protein